MRALIPRHRSSRFALPTVSEYRYGKLGKVENNYKADESSQNKFTVQVDIAYGSKFSETEDTNVITSILSLKLKDKHTYQSCESIETPSDPFSRFQINVSELQVPNAYDKNQNDTLVKAVSNSSFVVVESSPQ